MESISKIVYDVSDVRDVETEVGYMVKQTVSQGVNDGGVLAFRLPPDPHRFTDLNTLILRLEVSLTDGTGAAVAADKVVCLDTSGMHGLFSACDVRFNEEVVSTMTAYPYTATLSRYLGCASSIRDGVMDTLDGTHNPIQGFSNVGTSGTLKAAYLARKSRVNTNAILIGRIYSDVLTSSRQYLPPGMSLGIDLRRAPDHFSLISTEADATFKVEIKSASIYARRLKLRASLVPRVMEVLKKGGGMTFNRLETRIMAVNKGVQVFRWNDCLNSAPLPNRIYVGFIAQKSFYGHIGQLSTYFETLNMASLNLKLNGRDLLVDPLKTHFERSTTTGKLDKSKTDALDGFLSIAEVLNLVSDQTQPIRLNHEDYLEGMTIYAIELGKCGEKSGTNGYLDLELTFGTGGADLDACVIIFTEKTERILLHPLPI
jgi:hypothetical protein